MSQFLLIPATLSWSDYNLKKIKLKANHNASAWETVDASASLKVCEF